jgi:quinol monooxygenase YgiN
MPARRYQMHAVINNYRVPAEQVDEVVRRVDDLWLEQVRRMPGFFSYYVVRTSDDRLTSVALFLDQAASRQAALASAEWVGANLLDLDVQRLDTSDGELVVHGGGT